MKEITILSGKGGAGKTTLSAALASVAGNAVFCDNDVNAADLHLIFQPTIKEHNNFNSGNKAVIQPEKCTNCGLCAEKSITITENNNNSWYVSDTRFGILIHARMSPGAENSGRLVTQIREKAREIALQTEAEFIISDGPPGIGCSAISSITGTSLVLIVIEPTLSGLHDAKRLIQLVENFKIPILAVINKFDLNTDVSQNVINFLVEKKIKLLAKINFDKQAVESMVNGQTIIEFSPESTISEEIYYIWNEIRNQVTI